MMRRPQLSLRPTALGGKGLLLFAALELAFLATSYSNLFFLLLAFCCTLGGVGLWGTLRNLHGLRAAAFDAPLAAAGTERTVTVTLDGGARRRFAIAVAVPTDGGPCPIGAAAVIGAATPLSGALQAQPRGLRSVEHLVLSSRYPFGLFEARLQVPVRGELVTWPAAQPSETDDAGDDGEDGDGAASPQPGRGASWSGLREFRSGDAIGDVHWKATARRGTAVVKERERDRTEVLQLSLDRRLAAAPFERALAEAATFALAAGADGAPITLHSQGVALHVGSERAELDAALRWLAAADRLPDDAGPPSLRPGALALPRPRGGRR